MNKKTIDLITETKLCSSCGICKNVCPKSCIQWIRLNGMYYPSINEDACVECGICLKVCPGAHYSYSESDANLKCIYGKHLHVYNAWSKNDKIRYVSASGGVVSTMVDALLKENMYDYFFSIDTYNYQKLLTTNLKSRIDLENYPKSRYLPVSHENAIRFMKENPNKKIIIIGTSCVIRGIKNAIRILGLDEKQYLLVGLFCDQVFNYNINQYFIDSFSNNIRVKSIHFKNKESGGWPGNMKLLYEDGTYTYVDKSERERVKDYFIPERCLYCIDKLNVEADISLGDNYTKKHSSKLGSNSVIIRTKKGELAWNQCSGLIEYHSISIEELKDAQYLEGRMNNYYFSKLKEKSIQKKYDISLTVNTGIHPVEDYREFERAWKYKLDSVYAGAVYNSHPRKLERAKRISRERNDPKSLRTKIERVYFGLKRRIG